jgi:hypothetical protein
VGLAWRGEVDRKRLEVLIWRWIGVILILGMGIGVSVVFINEPHPHTPITERATLGFLTGLIIGTLVFVAASIPWAFLRLLAWAFDPKTSARGIREDAPNRKA